MILASHWLTVTTLTPDWLTVTILTPDWLTDTILTPDWLDSTRRRGSVQQEGSPGEVRAHGLRKVRSEAGHLSPTYTEDTGPGRGGDVVL